MSTTENKVEKVATFSFEERLRQKLLKDFEKGFRIEASWHEQHPLLDYPHWFVDDDRTDAGFTVLTREGNTIEVRLHESRYQSYFSPIVAEVHDLTFSHRSPQGEELDFVLIDGSHDRISVNGVKTGKPPIEILGLKLRPRLDQQDMMIFFQDYLVSSVDPDETRRRFKEKIEDYRTEAAKTGQLSNEDHRSIVGFFQGLVFNIWPEV